MDDWLLLPYLTSSIWGRETLSLCSLGSCEKWQSAALNAFTDFVNLWLLCFSNS